MEREQFNTTLPPHFAETVHHYMRVNNISKSEAVRELLRAGLDDAGYNVTEQAKPV